MNMLRLSPIAVAIATFLAAPVSSEAQVHLEVNPYVGVFIPDDSEMEDGGLELDAAALLGVRADLVLLSSLMVEFGYGWSSATVETSGFSNPTPTDGDFDVDYQVYYGAINYLVGNRLVPTKLILSGGVGGVSVDPANAPSESETLLMLGVGFTHPVSPWITFRGDIKDHIHLCDAGPAAGAALLCPAGDEPLHNIEVSGGLMFRLF